MKVYEIKSSTKGLEDGLYTTLSGAINAVRSAARRLGMFHKVVKTIQDEVFLVEIVNFR